MCGQRWIKDEPGFLLPSGVDLVHNLVQSAKRSKKKGFGISVSPLFYWSGREDLNAPEAHKPPKEDCFTCLWQAPTRALIAQPFPFMVGARGFEPPTPCSQSKCATRLRHAPKGTTHCLTSPALPPAEAGYTTRLRHAPKGTTHCLTSPALPPAEAGYTTRLRHAPKRTTHCLTSPALPPAEAGYTTRLRHAPKTKC